jgi:hydroxymethylbilane synthase
VAARLRAAHPGLDVQLVPMTTRGDRILDRPLAEIGGKGLFLKELEVAMLEGEADAAVHSLKDVPMELDGPFALAAVLERADPFDAFVSERYTDFDALPPVRAWAPPRCAGRRSCAPGARTCRWSTCAATSTRASRACSPATTTRSSSPAPAWSGWGCRASSAIASTRPAGCRRWRRARSRSRCRADDPRAQELLRVLEHRSTRTCVEAERAMNRRLHGSCTVPVAAYATLDGNVLSLEGLVGDAEPANASAPSEVGRATDPEGPGPPGRHRADAQGRRPHPAPLIQ